MRPGAAVPRAAATVIVVRDDPAGLQVLLLQRAEKGDHNSGAWVFPGGLVDDADRQAGGVCTGLDDVQASARLHLPEGGLRFHVAAVRECFEEAGVLLACDAQGQPVSLQGPAGERLLARRGSLHRGETSLVDVCREHGLTLPLDSLHYVGHWLTPRGRAKRFDTRFFLAALPPAQDTAHDAVETTDHVWLTPAEALSPAHRRRLMTPTRAMLQMLSDFADVPSLMAWARQPRVIRCVLPRLAAGPAGVEPVLPDHPAYEEIGRLDPDGQGLASSVLTLGEAVPLCPRVQRLVAFDGLRNSYLVRTTADAEVFDGVIDPAVPDAGHLDELLRAAGGTPRWVLTTHDGQANVEAARQLMARTGAHGVGPGLDEPSAAAGLADAPGLRWWVDPQGHGLQGWLLPDEDLLFCGRLPVGDRGRADVAGWAAPASGFLRALRREESPR